MPVQPHLRHLYTAPDYLEARDQVRLRSCGRCEWCFKPNGRDVYVAEDASGDWFDLNDEDPRWRDERGDLVYGRPKRPARLIRVVCSTAHLDHDPRNNALTNLAYLCQRCHLLYDGAHHRTTARIRWEARSGQMRLELAG